jgi:hypothetical protein
MPTFVGLVFYFLLLMVVLFSLYNPKPVVGWDGLFKGWAN